MIFCKIKFQHGKTNGNKLSVVRLDTKHNKLEKKQKMQNKEQKLQNLQKSEYF